MTQIACVVEISKELEVEAHLLIMIIKADQKFKLFFFQNYNNIVSCIFYERIVSLESHVFRDMRKINEYREV